MEIARKKASNPNRVAHVVKDGKGGAWVHSHRR